MYYGSEKNRFLEENLLEELKSLYFDKNSEWSNTVYDMVEKNETYDDMSSDDYIRQLYINILHRPALEIEVIQCLNGSTSGGNVWREVVFKSLATSEKGYKVFCRSIKED